MKQKLKIINDSQKCYCGFCLFFKLMTKIIFFQEQYKTIFLTLHEMLKASVTVQNTTEFLEKLHITKADNPVNISLLRKEYQV